MDRYSSCVNFPAEEPLLVHVNRYQLFSGNINERRYCEYRSMFRAQPVQWSFAHFLALSLSLSLGSIHKSPIMPIIILFAAIHNHCKANSAPRWPNNTTHRHYLPLVYTKLQQIVFDYIRRHFEPIARWTAQATKYRYPSHRQHVAHYLPTLHE